MSRAKRPNSANCRRASPRDALQASKTRTERQRMRRPPALGPPLGRMRESSLRLAARELGSAPRKGDPDALYLQSLPDPFTEVGNCEEHPSMPFVPGT